MNRFGILVMIIAAPILPRLAEAQHSVAYFEPNEARWAAEVVKSEAPAYPFVAKERHWQGKGVFRVKIDGRTGKVLEVRVVKSTGFKVLDDSSIIALGAWAWKPNRFREVDVGVSYVLDRGPRWSNLPKGAQPLLPSPY